MNYKSLNLVELHTYDYEFMFNEFVRIKMIGTFKDNH